MTTLYAVEFHWKDGYVLRSVVPQRETAEFYFLGQRSGAAFGYRNRVEKDQYATSPREAWERFCKSAEVSKAAAENRLADAQADIDAANAAIATLAEARDCLPTQGDK